jgi:hypothetical protein
MSYDESNKTTLNAHSTLGAPKITSLSVHTPDAGEIVGLGIVFQSASYADRYLRCVSGYWDCPPYTSHSFGVYFYDRGSHCDLAIDVSGRYGSATVDVKFADRQVLDHLLAALSSRPYYFIIACLIDQAGNVAPYQADLSVMYQSQFLLDGRGVAANRAGRWTKQLKLFSAPS